MEHARHLINKKNMKILLVDDEVISQCMTEMGLLRVGYKHFDIAINGKEALAMANNHHYDLVITDVWMPELDGIEFTKKLRHSKNKNANIPVIAVTTDQRPETKNSCLAAGVTEITYKPARGEVLDQSIQRIFLI